MLLKAKNTEGFLKAQIMPVGRKKRKPWVVARVSKLVYSCLSQVTSNEGCVWLTISLCSKRLDMVCLRALQIAWCNGAREVPFIGLNNFLPIQSQFGVHELDDK